MGFLLASTAVLLGGAAPQAESRAQEAEQPPLEETSVQAEGGAPRAEERLESLFAGALVGVQDAQDFAETPGYRRLLETLAQYGEEELRAKAVRSHDVSGALADPRAWRGEIVSVRALIAGQMAVRLARPLGEHVDAFRAFLTEADGSEGVVVDFLGQPPPLELQKDVVDLEAVFFRTVRYENRKGAFVEAPYLIARGIRRLETETLPRSTAFDGLAKFMIGAAVAFLVIRILASMRTKRPDPALDPSTRSIRQRAKQVHARSKPANKP